MVLFGPLQIFSASLFLDCSISQEKKIRHKIGFAIFILKSLFTCLKPIMDSLYFAGAPNKKKKN